MVAKGDQVRVRRTKIDRWFVSVAMPSSQRVQFPRQKCFRRRPRLSNTRRRCWPREGKSWRARCWTLISQSVVSSQARRSVAGLWNRTFRHSRRLSIAISGDQSLGKPNWAAKRSVFVFRDSAIRLIFENTRTTKVSLPHLARRRSPATTSSRSSSARSEYEVGPP
jgi:hypothetical protein